MVGVFRSGRLAGGGVAGVGGGRVGGVVVVLQVVGVEVGVGVVVVGVRLHRLAVRRDQVEEAICGGNAADGLRNSERAAGETVYTSLNTGESQRPGRRSAQV